MKKALLITPLLLLLLLGGAMLYLDKTGYWNDDRKALRELKATETPATPQQVQAATRAGDHHTLTLLQRAKVDFNDHQAQSEEGDFPLHTAIKSEDWETFRLLLRAGADPDLQNNLGLPATSYLIDAREFSTAAELVAQGAHIDIPHSSGQQYLIHAVLHRDHEVTAFLLKHGVSPQQSHTDGRTALKIAHQNKDAPSITLLLNAGADPSEKPEYGTSLFVDICKRLPSLRFTPQEEVEVVEAFVKAGSDLNTTDSSGWRPLQWLIHHRKIQASNAILRSDPSVKDLIWIPLHKRDYPLARRLLELGADPQERNYYSDHSILMEMVHQNQPEMITALINHGADPNQLGIEDQSALVTAISLKHTQAAMALLSHPQNPADHSQLMEHPTSDEFRALFGKKGYFDWYAKKVEGLTPLMAAVMMKELTVAEKLIANGANPTQGTASKSKVFPIQMAANNKDVKMQQLLIGVPYQDDQQVRNFIVDLSEQKVYYYKEGKLIKTSRVSTGRYGFRTPTGNYVITDRTKNKRSNIYDDSPMPYFQRFSCSAIGFHEGNTYSRFASHGCIRLPMSTAKYFWGEAKLGDRVKIRK